MARRSSQPAADGIERPLKPQWFQILLALSDEPRHGQGIVAEVLEQDGALAS